MSEQPDMAENMVEQTDRNIARFKDPVLSVAAGFGAALVIVTLPHIYLENIIGATGLSEIVPAAAPPLGNTARGLIAILAGMVSASTIYLFLNRKGSSDMGVALREQINAASPIELDLEEEAKAKKSRFSLPKFDAKSLTKFLKKPKKDKARVMDLADLPQLRKVDSESAAPERPPLFAETDEMSPVAEAIQPFEDTAASEVPDAETQEAQADEMSDAVMPSITPFTPPASEAAHETAPVRQEPAMPVSPDMPVAAQDLSDLTIAELADRLESGLNRLKQLDAFSRTTDAMMANAETVEPPETAPASEMHGEAPAIAHPPLKEVERTAEQVQAAQQADMDAALKAALGTLEKMTAQR
ncbi:hypothetical protein [Sphingorhabdus sp. Alg231-15]|uniref:hypothetical protein n=1 Tax=Sphingorhabdus sp. Alg231-15 TaxID=1922222 RepID=UPI000D54DB3B